MTVAEAISRAWTDAGFKDKLINDPHAALAEAGVKVPAGTTVKVVEDTAAMQHMVLPAVPVASREVPVDALEDVAGRKR